MKQEYSDEKYIYDQKQAAKNEGIQEGIERGIQKEKKQSERRLKRDKLNTAKKLVEKGFDLQEITRILNIPLSLLEELNHD
jgi:predicted transposase/invertase (TIGR01784 family)